MNVSDANELALIRGDIDWADAGSGEKAAALVRASDYILATYRLRGELGDDEQALVDLATYLVARDLLLNPVPLPTRSSAPVTKETNKLAGMENTVEFGAAPVDPFPIVTGILRSVIASVYRTSFAIGRAVR